MTPTEIDPVQLKWAVRVTFGLAVAALVAQVWYVAGADNIGVGALALTLMALWFAALMVVMLTAGFGAWRTLLTMPVVFAGALWAIVS